LAPTTCASNSAVVPTKGLVVFGGSGNALPYSQNLKSLDGSWEMGPYLFENLTISEHCTVQVFSKELEGKKDKCI